MVEPSGNESPGKRGSKGNLAGAIIVIVLAIAVTWLAHALYKNLQLQKCEMEGRRDCTNLAQPDQ